MLLLKYFFLKKETSLPQTTKKNAKNNPNRNYPFISFHSYRKKNDSKKNQTIEQNINNTKQSRMRLSALTWFCQFFPFFN